MGMFASPNRAAVMNSLPPGDRGAGGGMNQTFQNSAQVLSIGIFFTLMIVGLALDAAARADQRPRGARRRRRDRRTGRRIAAGLDPLRRLPRLQPDPAPGRRRTCCTHLPRARPGAAHRPPFFPHLISAPFRNGPPRGVRASRSSPAWSPPAASLMRGGRYHPRPNRRAPDSQVPPRRPIPELGGVNMQVEWHGQSAFHPRRRERRRSSSILSPTCRRPRPRHTVRLPADRGAREATCCSSPTSTSTTTGSRRSPASRASCAPRRGRLESPIGEVVAIASEHDDAGGHRARPEHDLRLRRSTACA